MRYRFTKDEIMEINNYDGSFNLSITIGGEYKTCTYMGYSRREAYSRFQNDFGTYPNNFVPLGTKHMCNFGGLAVMEREYGIDDYVIVCDNYGDGYKNITRNMIRYNTKGEPYFVRYGKRHYLGEFMRCDITKTVPKKYYTDRIYGGAFTYEEMVEDAKRNYDYGDPTNFLTYQKDWWKEYYKEVS